jgi:hypothetical protein
MCRRHALSLALLSGLLFAACGRGDEATRTDLLVAPAGGISPAAFAALSERLSEPGGFFPSDNLVSNETAFLHVVGALHERGVSGGAYLGVGPDQNFSYIAHIRPEIAFIIDIRRDNLLQHLLFKALFENARTRIEFLSLMLGKPLPHDLEAWQDATIDKIVLYLDGTPSSAAMFDRADEKVQESAQHYGFQLSEADLGTIRSVHAMFYEWGLDIRYSGRGRGRFGRFPTWRNLLLQTDLEGNRAGYLASEEAFQFVKDLERRNLVVPVVGDLGGPHALAAIGHEVGTRGLHISAFYVSNVEQYLMQGDGFARFAATVADLPFDENSLFIRSYFPRGWAFAQTQPGHFSVQLLELFSTFVRETQAGGYQTYLDLITRNALPLGPVDDSARATGS